MNHVSYHKVKLGEDNFGALANSKIEVYLHKIDIKHNNMDSIIGKGDMCFNKIFLSKDFFYSDDIQFYNYIPEEIKDDDKNKPTVKKNYNKQPIKQVKKKKENDIPYKIGILQVSCQLFKSTSEKEPEKLKQTKVKELVENFNPILKEEKIIDEYKLDCDEVITLFLQVNNYKPVYINNLD